MGAYNKATFTTIRTRRDLNKRLASLKPLVEQTTGRTNLSFGEIIDHLIDNYQQPSNKVQFGNFDKSLVVKQSGFKNGVLLVKREQAKEKLKAVDLTKGGSMHRTKPKNLKSGLFVKS